MYFVGASQFQQTGNDAKLRELFQVQVLNAFATRYNEFVIELQGGVYDARKVKKLRAAWATVEKVMGWEKK